MEGDGAQEAVAAEESAALDPADEQASAEPPSKKAKKKKKASSTNEAPSALKEEPLAVKEEPLPSFKKKKTNNTDNTETSKDFTVFVDGVPYTWTVDKVEDYFRECGEILEVKAPTWQDSGRLRGFAHVSFSTKAARDKALGLNGSKVDNKGRFLKIDPAKAPEAAATLSDEQLEGMRRLFVKNLPYDATEKEIADLFGKMGKIIEVRVPTSFGRAKGFAYVEFQKSAGLKAAMTQKPVPELRGRTLRMDVDSGSGPKAGFHFRKEAFQSGFVQKTKGEGKGSGKGGGKGKKGDGKGKGGKGPKKLGSLF